MKEIIEIQHWGWNPIIITSFLTICFTIFQGYGIVKQSQKIWRTKSGKSISTFAFFFGCFYFFSFIFYGLEKMSLAIIFNGLLGFLYLPIVIGLIKFKKFKLYEKILLPITALVIPVMIMTAEKDLLLFILLMVTLITIVTQVLEIRKEKSRGSVEIKFVVIFLLTNIFWLIYAFIIGNWPLEIFNSLAIVVYSWGICLYKKYK